MAASSPLASDRKVLIRFEEETGSTVIPCVGAKRNTTSFFYVSDDEISDAGSVPSAYQRLRSRVNVVKLIKPFARRKTENLRPEFKVLEKIVSDRHPNIVDLVGFDENLHSYVQLSYVGPNLQILEKFDYTLPHACLWSIFRDITAALAFLHWGIPTSWKEGDPIPANRRPISHGALNATTIHLSTRHKSRSGYPRAVITDFSHAAEQNPIQGGGEKTAHEWHRSKLDVSNAACVMHTLAHGLPFKNETPHGHMRKDLACACLDARNCPGWLTRESLDREMAGVLGLACNIDDEQVTAMALLGYVNGAQGFARRFPEHGPRLQQRDLARLASELPTNAEIRSAVPRLRGVFVDAEDREMGDADLVGGGVGVASPVDERGVSLRFKSKVLGLIVHGSEEWGIPPSPGSDGVSLASDPVSMDDATD